MSEFNVKIAGCTIAVTAVHPKMKEIFKDYLTEEAPLLAVESDESDILAECQHIMQSYIDKHVPDDSILALEAENNLLYQKVAERLSDQRVVLMHGSAIAVDGEAYIFVAPSGTGKSTHARLWRDMFGSHAVMINDDRPFLKCTDDEIVVCGSPWNGKHHLGSNLYVPLKAICFLERGEYNRIEQIDSAEAFFQMFRFVYYSKDAEREARILQLLHCIREKTAFYRLQCNTEPVAAAVSYEGMKAGIINENKKIGG